MLGVGSAVSAGPGHRRTAAARSAGVCAVGRVKPHTGQDKPISFSGRSPLILPAGAPSRRPTSPSRPGSGPTSAVPGLLIAAARRDGHARPAPAACPGSHRPGPHRGSDWAAADASSGVGGVPPVAVLGSDRRRRPLAGSARARVSETSSCVPSERPGRPRRSLSFRGGTDLGHDIREPRGTRSLYLRADFSAPHARYGDAVPASTLPPCPQPPSGGLRADSNSPKRSHHVRMQYRRIHAS
jgi:hypothetical protein